MRIRVEPFGEGWGVLAEDVANVQAFRSGAEAERAARDLARRVASSGEPVQADVMLRTGEIVPMMRFEGFDVPGRRADDRRLAS